MTKARQEQISLYDDVGLIKDKTTEHGNYSYEYDDLYRLTQAENPNTETEKFTYDNVGNRKTEGENQQEWQYNQNHQLLSRPDYTYDYDVNGSMTQITKNGEETNYIYNARNRLTQIKDKNNQTIAKYQYDPFGRRISKEVSGTKTYYLYTPQGLSGEYTETGELIRGYGYKPDSIWTTDPLYLKTNGQYYFYHNDHLGTSQKLTGTNGEVVWDARYAAFGKAYIKANKIDNPLRFAGQYHDAESGLYYNFNRYYDPELGRYITSDPIGLQGGINTYAYVGGRPLRSIDPRGLDCNNWAEGEIPGGCDYNYNEGIPKNFPLTNMPDLNDKINQLTINLICEKLRKNNFNIQKAFKEIFDLRYTIDFEYGVGTKYTYMQEYINAEHFLYAYKQTRWKNKASLDEYPFIMGGGVIFHSSFKSSVLLIKIITGIEIDKMMSDKGLSDSWPTFYEIEWGIYGSDMGQYDMDYNAADWKDICNKTSTSCPFEQ